MAIARAAVRSPSWLLASGSSLNGKARRPSGDETAGLVPEQHVSWYKTGASTPRSTATSTTNGASRGCLCLGRQAWCQDDVVGWLALTAGGRLQITRLRWSQRSSRSSGPETRRCHNGPEYNCPGPRSHYDVAAMNCGVGPAEHGTGDLDRNSSVPAKDAPMVVAIPRSVVLLTWKKAADGGGTTLHLAPSRLAGAVPAKAASREESI